MHSSGNSSVCSSKYRTKWRSDESKLAYQWQRHEGRYSWRILKYIHPDFCSSVSEHVQKISYITGSKSGNAVFLNRWFSKDQTCNNLREVVRTKGLHTSWKHGALYRTKKHAAICRLIWQYQAKSDQGTQIVIKRREVLVQLNVQQLSRQLEDLDFILLERCQQQDQGEREHLVKWTRRMLWYHHVFCRDHTAINLIVGTLRLHKLSKT